MLDINKESVQHITPKCYVDFGLKKGDILISKDSNVGEIVILDRDYPNAMPCGALYRLPVTKNKYYLLAFIKNKLFRQQINYLVPRGSTIRHGKTKFLKCRIPMPNSNAEATIQYVELLMQAIINKEAEIHKKHQDILQLIEKELQTNQLNSAFKYSLPTIDEISTFDRLDSSLYSEEFKRNEFAITNYSFGFQTVLDLGFEISRGQNLQISNIGKSIQIKEQKEGYYKLILPKFLSKYGTVNEIEYLGNPNNLKTLRQGDIIFGAEGNEKGRSLVIIEPQEMTITNIHGITLNQNSHNIEKGIFVKLFLDYYRSKGMIDAYAVGGNGGSLAIKYWGFLKFPKFPAEKEQEIINLYHNSKIEYEPHECSIETFLHYDIKYNQDAGIYEIDKSMKYLQNKLNKALSDIANDIPVTINF